MLKNKLKYISPLLISLIPVTVIPITLSNEIIVSRASKLKTINSLQDWNNANPLEVARQSSFDARQFNVITPVKNQGPVNICWTYALASISETAILKNNILPEFNNTNLDIEELNIDYVTNVRNANADKLNLTTNDTFSQPLRVEGNRITGARMLSQWNGPSLQGQDVDKYASNPIAKIKDYIELDPNDKPSIKASIAKFGSVSLAYKAGRHYKNVSDIYINSTNVPDVAHAVTVVGWDDNIPASKFNNVNSNLVNTTTNGAWLVKNSWGTRGVGMDGYFWLSYESPIISPLVLDYMPSNQYDNSYYYNGMNKTPSGQSVLQSKSAGVIFAPQKAQPNNPEILKGASFEVAKGNNVTATIKVYLDVQANFSDPKDVNNTPISNNLVYQKQINVPSPGMYTVNFDKQIELNPGQNFSIVVELSNNDNTAALKFILEPNSNNDMSYYNSSSNSWKSSLAYKDKHNVVNIKAFTLSPNKTNQDQNKPLPPKPPLNNQQDSSNQNNNDLNDYKDPKQIKWIFFGIIIACGLILILCLVIMLSIRFKKNNE